MGPDAHRRTAGRLRPVELPIEARLRGRFLRRYKRFFADVESEDGRMLTVHCANPGSMLGFDRPGAPVRCSTSDDPRRKLRHTLEMMRVGRTWVGLHTTRANQVVGRALEAGAVPELRGYRAIRREVRVDERSRLDFALLRHPRDERSAFVEVKSVTLCAGSVALFPDSVSERGRRHLETLARLRRRGHRAAILYLVQRADCDRVAPADDIDPAYGAALRCAADAGVELFALGARVTARSIAVERSLPVVL